jgi:hypothetical protein
MLTSVGRFASINCKILVESHEQDAKGENLLKNDTVDIMPSERL